MEDVKGHLLSAFDFSFSEFITTKIVKILYGLAILASAFTALSWMVSGFDYSIGTGIMALILSPAVFFLLVLTARVWLELVIVIFRIAEDVHALTDSGAKGEQPQPAD